MTEAEAFWIPRTYHQIGHIYLNHMKQPQKALEYLEKACANNGNYVEFGIDLAEAYRQTGEHEKAVESLEKSASLYEQLHHEKFKRDIIQIAKELKLPKEWIKQYRL
jgi:tetratricopeptide (TPR) repeat protein